MTDREKSEETLGDGRDDVVRSVRRRTDRARRWKAEGEPTVLRFVGQIGILGWIILLPTLGGLFLGRWIDHRLGTGIFWSAPLLMLGAALGFWSAWRWMHSQ